jgi:alpha-galactosidase
LQQQNMWVLRARHSDYVIRTTPEGKVEHCYWGARQSTADYERLQGGQHWFTTSHTERSGEEIAPWGGLKVAEPGLKVSFANHIRDLCLIYDRHEIIDGRHLVITLKDSLQPLRVRLHYRLIEECDLIERYVDIVNEGQDNVTLEQVMSAVWHLPVYPEYRLTYLTGHWNAEFQLRRETVQEGKKVLESRCGLSGHLYNPWFAVDFGDAAEEHGEVYYGAIAFSGNWKLVIEKTLRQSLQIAAGLNDFDFAWTLKAEDTFTSPVCVGGFTSHGFGQASRDMHRYQREYVLRSGDRLRPVIYNSWYATRFDVTEEGQKKLAEKAAAIGAEYFVVDDGWFGDKRSERSKLGDWTADPGKFPNGLGPLIACVKSLGMQFGIWVEPENVGPDSELYRRHPDWIYHFPGRPRSHLNKEYTLNLAREDVKQYIVRSLDDLLSQHDIAYVKWDMNRYFSEPGWPDAQPEHHREIWIRHVQGLYDILETLREKHPRVLFESCASGGGRTDLGVMKYVEQFWTSDNTDGFDRQFIQEGYTYAYTPKAMMCWVASPARIRPRTTSIRYRFHCAMTGSLGISLDLTRLDERELAECREYVELYKRIRPTIQDGDLYRLSSPRSAEGTAVQYVNAERSETVLFAFRHSQQFAHPPYPIRLRGLDPQGVYVCEQSGVERSGASLMHAGVQLGLKGDFDSELLVFRKKMT